MTVELGSPFTPPKNDAPSSDVFVRAIVGEVTRQLASQFSEIDRRIAAIATRAPAPVNVQASPVHVPAPQVTVAAPQVSLSPSIEMPEMGPMTCTVEMPGLDRLCGLLEQMVGLMQRPVEKTVQRDRGVITSVTERRV